MFRFLNGLSWSKFNPFVPNAPFLFRLEKGVEKGCIGNKWVNEVILVKPSAPYALRDENELCSRNPKTVTYGTESVSFLAPKTWSTKFLDSFLKSLRKWKLICPCLLCKTYFRHVSFLLKKCVKFACKHSNSLHLYVT